MGFQYSPLLGTSQSPSYGSGNLLISPHRKESMLNFEENPFLGNQDFLGDLDFENAKFDFGIDQTIGLDLGDTAEIPVAPLAKRRKTEIRKHIPKDKRVVRDARVLCSDFRLN